MKQMHIATIETFAPPTPRYAQMVAVTREHGEAELTLDLDLVMATMTTDVWWEFAPLGVRCEGAGATREWYRRVLPVIIPRIVSATEKTVAYGVNEVVLEHDVTLRLPDGTLHASPVISIFEFKAQKMTGERIYCDAAWTELYVMAMGSDFASFPGVSIRGLSGPR